ncbi:MAG: glycosyltransferase [Proteobacteria bacterium]|nr:glycosyltransferase [Pseudomonadota bacterium]
MVKSLIKRNVKRLIRNRLGGIPIFPRRRKSPPIKPEGEVGPVYAFIRSWNRPHYLWACLDSLYRSTNYPCRFVLIDNKSTDPQIRRIVEGFERRGFFHAVHFMERNLPSNQTMAFFRYRAEMGRYMVLLDSDIMVEQSDPCWLTRLIAIAEKRSELAVLGSYIDKSDFVDRKWARRAAPDIPEQQLDDLIKANSPERRLPSSTAEVIYPFNPPGRLLLLRTDVVDQIGLTVNDVRLWKAVLGADYRAGIATEVRHRHLSLLNLFDYADHDFTQLRSYLKG